MVKSAAILSGRPSKAKHPGAKSSDTSSSGGGGAGTPGTQRRPSLHRLHSQRYLGRISDVHFFHVLTGFLRDVNWKENWKDEAASINRPVENADGYDDRDEPVPDSLRDHFSDVFLLEAPGTGAAAARYIDIYFSTIHVAYPFVPRSLFEEACRSLHASSRQQDEDFSGPGLALHCTSWDNILTVDLYSLDLVNQMQFWRSARFTPLSWLRIIMRPHHPRHGPRHHSMRHIFDVLSTFHLKIGWRDPLRRSLCSWLNVSTFWPCAEQISKSTTEARAERNGLCVSVRVRGLHRFCFAFSLRYRCWNTLGLAIRIAQSLGLHVEAEESGNNHYNDNSTQVTKTKAEIRRRAWHSLYVLDRLLALQLGRPPAIHDDDCHVPMPSRLDDDRIDWNSDYLPQEVDPRESGGYSEGDYFIQVIKLSGIIGQVLRELNKPQRQRLIVNEFPLTKALDRRLLAWKMELPRFLRFDLGHALEKSLVLKKQVIISEF